MGGRGGRGSGGCGGGEQRGFGHFDMKVEGVGVGGERERGGGGV